MREERRKPSTVGARRKSFWAYRMAPELMAEVASLVSSGRWWFRPVVMMWAWTCLRSLRCEPALRRIWYGEVCASVLFPLKPKVSGC